jgi:hypothetical protein
MACAPDGDGAVAAAGGLREAHGLGRERLRLADAWWAAYARAAGAELAVVAHLPDAAERIVRTEPFAAENDWAAACLARARGRLGDPTAMANAVERWERIDARFERDCTVALMR